MGDGIRVIVGSWLIAHSSMAVRLLGSVRGRGSGLHFSLSCSKDCHAASFELQVAVKQTSPKAARLIATSRCVARLNRDCFPFDFTRGRNDEGRIEKSTDKRNT